MAPKAWRHTVSSTPIELHARNGVANGTDGLQTINQDDPSAIGRRASTNSSLQSAVSRRLSLS